MYQSKVSVNYSEENSVFGGSLLLVLIQFQFQFESQFHSSGWDGGRRLFEARRLLTFSAFRMGACLRWSPNSRLGAYSNKFGMFVLL